MSERTETETLRLLVADMYQVLNAPEQRYYKPVLEKLGITTEGVDEDVSYELRGGRPQYMYGASPYSHGPYCSECV